MILGGSGHKQVLVILTFFTLFTFVPLGSCVNAQTQAPSCPIPTTTDPSWPYPLPAILNEPSPVGKEAPMVKGNVELNPYRMNGYNRQSGTFYLTEGETIDIVVSSAKQRIYYSSSLGQVIHFYLQGPQKTMRGRSYRAPETHIWDWGKRLYENLVINTDQTETQVSTAVRLIAWNNGMHEIEFFNDSAEPAVITYEIYRAGIVPDFIKYIQWVDEMEERGMWK